MTTVLITTTGAGTVTIPAHIGSVFVECWGAGQNGRDLNGYNGVDTSAPSAAKGGHGGAYAKKTLTLAAGTYAYYVGAAGDTTDTSFNSTSCKAQCGQSGGSSTSSTGDTKYSGGAGGTPGAGPFAGGSGGGASGSLTGVGGNGGAGGDPAAAAGGTPTLTGGLVAGTDAGAGGGGDSGNIQLGEDGQAPGGGGGGGALDGDTFGGQGGAPGLGARGQIRIRYTIPNAFDSLMLDDMTNVFLNTSEFAETITYNPYGGSPIDISAIVDRDPPQLDGQIARPKMRVTVANDAATGILSSSLNTGADTITVAYRRGGDEASYLIRRSPIDPEDSASLILELE